MFSRSVDREVHTFGVSGLLRGSNLIMYDHQTETWRQQFTGEAVVGELAGRQLRLIPTRMVSWASAREAFADIKVLSRDTGFEFPYGINPYEQYDVFTGPKFDFLSALPDERLYATERVAGVSLDGENVAFPYAALRVLRVINDAIGGQPVVVFYTPRTLSPLTEKMVADGPSVGATGVFRSIIGVTLRADGEDIVDQQTGSRWNVLGLAVDGPLAGERLPAILHTDVFWFAWAAFNPDTRIVIADR